ncbi:hypothetical protein PAHAL_1G300000 [Panicum hallii]|uniref:Uncharacterized protein n=1 Tax=Panicum hallii TaxID=206008 RepID=A0A2S3GR46_9POAL|nr:uncharacterized protein LOC112900407 [Panicum hallii]PAN06943.1 hypothetical protein PAHAL_1G300000 [Panicum hallii]
MQKHAVAVIVAAVVLGLVALVLGFAAEYVNQKAFVRSDVFRCEYRRTPALGWGILAALLSLAAVTLVTAASGCFGRFGAAAAPAARRRRGGCARTSCAAVAWLVVAAAAVMFLYGASRNAGGTGGFTAIRRRPGRNSDGGVSTFDFVCDELRGVFVLASIAAVVAVACAITAYVDTLQRRNQTATPPTLGVAMGQPDPAPVAYPAQPPYGGYGAKQPAGTS